jgi:hypothetical protein
MQMTDSGQQIYDEALIRALAIAKELIGEFPDEQIVIEAIADAFKDASNTVSKGGE